MVAELSLADYRYDGALGSENKNSSSSELMCMANGDWFYARHASISVGTTKVNKMPSLAQGLGFRPRIHYSATGHYLSPKENN